MAKVSVLQEVRNGSHKMCFISARWEQISGNREQRDFRILIQAVNKPLQMCTLYVNSPSSHLQAGLLLQEMVDLCCHRQRMTRLKKFPRRGWYHLQHNGLATISHLCSSIFLKRTMNFSIYQNQLFKQDNKNISLIQEQRGVVTYRVKSRLDPSLPLVEFHHIFGHC